MARNREPDAMGMRTMDMPIIDTPWSRIGENWANHQHTTCAAWELDYMRCASSVGEQRARTECKNYLDDFLECRDQTKTVSFLSGLAARLTFFSPALLLLNNCCCIRTQLRDIAVTLSLTCYSNKITKVEFTKIAIVTLTLTQISFRSLLTSLQKRAVEHLQIWALIANVEFIGICVCIVAEAIWSNAGREKAPGSTHATQTSGRRDWFTSRSRVAAQA